MRREMPKRRAEPAIESVQRRSEQPWFEVDRHVLAGLGWDGASPLAADEDELYRWLTEPELWVQHVGLMRELDARVRRRLVQLHSNMHGEMHASGFVLWRALPARRPRLTLTVRNSKTPQLPPRRALLPEVTFRQHRITPRLP